MSKIFADNSLYGSNGYGDKTWCSSGFGDTTGFGNGRPYVYVWSGDLPSDFEGFGTGNGSGYSSGYGNVDYAGGDLDERNLCK